MTDKHDEALRRHISAMEELRQRITQATGYHKLDLMRQFERMRKERDAYMRLRKGGSK